MPSIIVYLLAGIFTGVVLTICFLPLHRKLSVKRKTLADLREQMHLHERLFSEARDGPNEQAAARMLQTSRMLCREAAKGYNCILHKPIHRIPALLMGFREEKKE